MQQLIESLDTTASDFIVKEAVNYNNYIIIGVILISLLICYYFFYLIYKKKFIINKYIRRLKKDGNNKTYLCKLSDSIKDLIFDYNQQIYYFTELEICLLLRKKKLLKLADFFQNINNLKYQKDFSLKLSINEINKLKDEIRNINGRCFSKAE